MPAPGPGQGVVIVVTSLRNFVGAEVSHVLDLIVVSADQRDSAQQGGIAVDDPQLRAQRHAIGRRHVAERRADKSYPSLVDYGRIDRRGETHRSAPRMIEVRSRAESRRQRGQTSCFRLIRPPAAEPDKERILRIHKVVPANVEIVPVLDELPAVFVIVEHGKTVRILSLCAIWRGERLKVFQAYRIDPVRGNDVSGKLRRPVWIVGIFCLSSIGRRVIDRN